MDSYPARIETVDAQVREAVGPLVVEFPLRRGGRHRFTVDEFTGAHLLHLAVAGCVYNDLMREAAARGIALTRITVTADGGFTSSPFASTGMEYEIVLEGDADEGALSDLVAYVEQIAEIPAALRSGMDVRLMQASVRRSEAR